MKCKAILITLSVFLTVVLVSVITYRLTAPIDEKTYEQTYEQYKSQFEQIKSFITNAGYKSVKINSHYDSCKSAKSNYIDKMLVSQDGTDNISLFILNQDILTAINEIFSTNMFNDISYDDDCLIIQAYDDFDCSKGYSYSFTSKLPNIQFMTQLVQLDNSEWYYFESDYNTYRISDKTVNN
jgi:hypothetical protein